MTAPSRSARFSFSERKTIPLRPDFLHCASRWRATIPRGAEEEIAVRDEEFFRFVALPATRALLERPTFDLSLIRDQLRLMARVASIRRAMMGAAPGTAYICEFDRGRTVPIYSPCEHALADNLVHASAA